jgi:hypothetical protein
MSGALGAFPGRVRSDHNRGAPMGDVLTPQQINEIEIKYKAFKVMYCSDMPSFSTDLLSDEEVSRIKARLSLLGQIQKKYNNDKNYIYAGIITHLMGDLRSRLLMDENLRKPDAERDRWNSLSQADRNYETWTKAHPEMRVGGNPLATMTGSIVDQSQSQDVAVFQAAVISAITALAMGATMIRRVLPDDEGGVGGGGGGGGGGGTQRIPLDKLESPKRSIVDDARYQRAAEGVRTGEAPPIEVEPTGRGTYRIQEGVRRSVGAREAKMSDIPAKVVKPTQGAPRTIPLRDVKLEPQ